VVARRIALLSLVLHLGILAGALVPRSAYAHAELARADPAVDAIVEASPTRVTLWFTEEPEPRFSEIQVVDRTGRRVDRGDLRADPADRLALSVGVPELTPGSYGVVWRALSTVDGHITRGSYTFTIGLDQVPTEVGVGVGNTGTMATPERVAFRVMTYAGYAALFGAIPFLWLVVLPAFSRAPALQDMLYWIIQRSRIVALVGLGLALLAALGAIATQAADAAGTSLLGALGGPIASVAFGTRYGVLWWVRVGLIMAVGALLLLPDSPRRPAIAGPLACALAATALAAHALTSHAAATGSALAPVATEWAHLFAVTLWVGGLLHLAVALPVLGRSEPKVETARVAAEIVPRFSALGAIAVLTLVGTGVYQSWLLVGGLPALLGTPYGRGLLLKLLLVPLLLTPAAINLFVLRPRLAQASRLRADVTPILRNLRRTVGAELAVASAILLVVGFLTNMQPGRDALAAQGVTVSTSAEDLRATLQVQPGISGPNRFDVLLTDRAGRPITDAEKIALRFTMQTMDMGETELTAIHRGEGHYVAQGGALVMDGPWQIEAVVRRPGRDDVRPVFAVDVRAPAPTGGRITAAPLAEGDVLLGVELLLLGFGVLAFALWSAPRNRPRVRLAVPFAVAAVLAGSLIAGAGFATLSAEGAGRNPVPPTRESVARGREIYAERCTFCHGETGRGDGPLGIGLNPRPADFRTHLAAGHTDAQLYDWITNGVPGTAMPPFGSELSETDRWNVLNYIKANFGGGVTRP
jgi:copper transport protein